MLSSRKSLVLQLATGRTNPRIAVLLATNIFHADVFIPWGGTDVLRFPVWAKRHCRHSAKSEALQKEVILRKSLKRQVDLQPTAPRAHILRSIQQLCAAVLLPSTRFQRVISRSQCRAIVSREARETLLQLYSLADLFRCQIVCDHSRHVQFIPLALRILQDFRFAHCKWNHH